MDLDPPSRPLLALIALGLGAVPGLGEFRAVSVSGRPLTRYSASERRRQRRTTTNNDRFGRYLLQSNTDGSDFGLPRSFVLTFLGGPPALTNVSEIEQ